MLVLTRKIDEKIIIETQQGLIEIVIVEIRGDKVRLGVTAESSIPVHREEIYERIQNENKNQQN